MTPSHAEDFSLIVRIPPAGRRKLSPIAELARSCLPQGPFLRERAPRGCERTGDVAERFPANRLAVISDIALIR